MCTKASMEKQTNRLGKNTNRDQHGTPHKQTSTPIFYQCKHLAIYGQPCGWQEKGNECDTKNTTLFACNKPGKIYDLWAPQKLQCWLPNTTTEKCWKGAGFLLQSLCVSGQNRKRGTACAYTNGNFLPKCPKPTKMRISESAMSHAWQVVCLWPQREKPCRAIYARIFAERWWWATILHPVKKSNVTFHTDRPLSLMIAKLFL